MNPTDMKRRLKILFGWTMPTISTLSGIWSPNAQSATPSISSNPELFNDPSPLTFINPLNKNAVNIFAGHSSHRSHSSHSSHSSHRSHYSSSGGSAPPSTPTPSVPPKSSTGQLETLVMRVQLELQMKKLYDGPISGEFDAKTKEALRGFQRRNGLDPSGYMDTPTLSALGISVP